MEYKLIMNRSEVDRCLICDGCTSEAVCPEKLPIGDILRSLYFENIAGAASKLVSEACLNCNAPCQDKCRICGITRPVHIKNIFSALISDIPTLPKEKKTDVDISTDICGVKLQNPFLLSSSVVGSNYDMCSRAFKAGWAGVSFKTVCNFPQHETSPRFSTIHSHANSFCGFKNIEQLSDHSVVDNMKIFRRLKSEFPDKVIIASIMGRNEKEWAELASMCQENGASVIECNFSCPNMEDGALGSTIGQSAELVEKYTRAVKQAVTIPVLTKLTPNVTDMTVIARAAKRGGADGISAINTISSITGVDIDTLVAEPSVHGQSMIGGYSGPAVKPIALRFISELSQCKELKDMHISGMGGIETWRDALEFTLLGASSLQITTAVMQYGYRIIDDLKDGLIRYMKCKGIQSLDMLTGASVVSVVAHENVERDTILLPTINQDKCIGCGRCYISCKDGGHQAISIDKASDKPRIDGRICVGCHLCRLVCPVSAIGTAQKRIPAHVNIDGGKA